MLIIIVRDTVLVVIIYWLSQSMSNNIRLEQYRLNPVHILYEYNNYDLEKKTVLKHLRQL